MGKVRGRPFQAGNSFGRGRPKGAKNKTTLLVQQLLGEYAEAITRTVVLQSLKGDRPSQRLCMERISAPQREAHVRIHLGPTKTAAELDVASQRVLRSVGNGTITPANGEILSNILEFRRRAIESAQIESRLERLEQDAKSRRRKAA